MTAVRERMTDLAASVGMDTRLVEAAQRLRSSGAGGLTVLDGRGNGDCAAIVTERDIVVRLLAEGRDPRAAVVRDVATVDPVVCAASDDLGTALQLMRRHGVQHLPVLEGKRVVGLISLADILFGRSDQERAALDPGQG